MKTAILGALTLCAMASGADAATATRAPFGALADGTKVEAVTLSNGAGISAKIMTLGATLQSLIVPDKAGHKDDVVLGYDTAAEYLAHPDFFGASVGRYANRIAKGKFSLDGKAYTLATNDQLTNADGFRSIVVAYRSGAPIRLREVAHVEDGAPIGGRVERSGRQGQVVAARADRERQRRAEKNRGRLARDLQRGLLRGAQPDGGL